MPNDAVLLKEYARTQDADAFSNLAHRHAGLVYGTCLRITRNLQDAEDVAQDCFAELARRAGSVRTSLPGWLHALATSRSVDLIRRSASRRAREREAVMRDWKETAPTWEDLEPYVDEALERLPDELRVALVSHYLEGRSQTEIAAELGVNQSTISRRIENGLEKLRARLKEVGVVTSVGVLATLLDAHAQAVAPATLLAALGKMALSGLGGVPAVATGLALSTKMAVAVAALVLGAVCFVRPWSADNLPALAPVRKTEGYSLDSRVGPPAADRSAAVKSSARSSGDSRNRSGTIIALGDGLYMELVWIPPGEFMMGLPRVGGSGPVHKVTISKGFWMGRYEVTQEQYERVMGENPSHFPGRRNPVEKVTWHDARIFCRILERQTPEYDDVDLATEAEWEYACLAGTTTAYYRGSAESDIVGTGWYRGNSDETSHPVGEKMPNAFGLHDMHGNVWEWCADRYGRDYDETTPSTDPTGPSTGTDRVMRGGSWRLATPGCYSGARRNEDPRYADWSVGFRVVVRSGCSLPATKTVMLPAERKEGGQRPESVPFEEWVKKQGFSDQVALCAAMFTNAVRETGLLDLPSGVREGAPDDVVAEARRLGADFGAAVVEAWDFMTNYPTGLPPSGTPAWNEFLLQFKGFSERVMLLYKTGEPLLAQIHDPDVATALQLAYLENALRLEVDQVERIGTILEYSHRSSAHWGLHESMESPFSDEAKAMLRTLASSNMVAQIVEELTPSQQHEFGVMFSTNLLFEIQVRIPIFQVRQ